MKLSSSRGASFVLLLVLILPALSQTPAAQLTPEKIAESAYPSVALVLAGRTPAQRLPSVGSAIVIRENGVLLTAYHVVKDAYALQVRFKDGEAFDGVQLLGVDPRRDVAAIKIAASGLAVLPVGSPNDSKPGDAVTVVSNAAALPWSVSTGVIAAYRLADEVPGAGSGYRLVQFTAPASPGSSGGVLIDSRGRALGLIVGSLVHGQNLNFAVPLESVLGLADSPVRKVFAYGSALIQPGTAVPPVLRPSAAVATPDAPEKSDLLSASKDREFILRNFKTMFVDASRANYFGNDQMKAALARNKGFSQLNIRIVDDLKVADVVLHVGYTFAWDYPFELKHQNTTIVLLAGKGTGPFSGPAGAASVASQFVKLIKPYRTTSQKKK